jgi:hypothetical protein
VETALVGAASAGIVAAAATSPPVATVVTAMFAAVVDAGVAAGVGASVRCSGTRGAVGTARWSWRLGTAGGKESVLGSGLVVLRIVLLLEQQIGTRRQEGVGGILAEITGTV